MEKANNILVTRADLTSYLLNHGFTIVSIAKNRHEPAKTVFFFKPEDGLADAMTFFMQNIATEYRY